MINLEPLHLNEIKRVLREYVPECEVQAFGSRISGTANKYSDVDLVLRAPGKIGPGRIEAVKDALSDLNIPMMVDLHDWHALPENFRMLIERQYEIIQKP